MNFDDLMALLGSANPEQVAALKEFIAPETKYNRKNIQLTNLLNDINAGAARARALVQARIDELNRQNYEVEVPTWDAVVASFDGR